jgi:hypothetical protein
MWAISPDQLVELRRHSTPHRRADDRQELTATRLHGPDAPHWQVGAGDDRWEVTQSTLERAYEIVRGLPNWEKELSVRPRGWASLVTIPDDFQLDAACDEAPLAGSAGDQLAFDVNGRCRVVPQAAAARSYRAITAPWRDDDSVRVFLSYAHSDATGDGKKAFETLVTCLSGRERLDLFVDRANLKAGDPFPSVLMERIATAHVVVIVIGAGWLAGQYARHIELPMALLARAERGTQVVPIPFGSIDISGPLTATADFRGTEVNVFSQFNAVERLWTRDDGATDDEILNRAGRILASVKDTGGEVRARWKEWADHPVRPDVTLPAAPVPPTDAPTERRPLPSGRWTADSVGGELRFTEARGATVILGQRRDFRAAGQTVRLDGAASSLVAADDGCALFAGMDGRLAVIGTGLAPGVWDDGPELAPDERVLAARRVGRTYAVLVGNADGTRPLVVDSAGATRDDPDDARDLAAEDAAAGTSGFLAIGADGALRGAGPAAHELRRRADRPWVSLDSACGHGNAGGRVVTAAIGTGEGGDRRLVVVAEAEAGTRTYVRTVTSSAHRVAVARPAQHEPPEWVVVEDDDVLNAWSLTDLGRPGTPA